MRSLGYAPGYVGDTIVPVLFVFPKTVNVHGELGAGVPIWYSAATTRQANISFGTQISETF